VSRKKLLVNLIIAALITPLLGCSKETEEEIIVLKEPVNASAGYVSVEARDLYDAKVFSSVVSPYVEEYSFSYDQVFNNYECIPGQKVAKGDVLVSSVTKDSKDAITEVEEAIEDLISSHTVEAQHTQSDIDAAKENESKYGVSESSRLNVERMEEKQKESNELFFLENEHLNAKKELIKNESRNANIFSDLEGEVVNCALVYGSEEIEKGIPLVAVGDLNRKLLKTEYLSQATIAKAKDFYAVVDGKRYELIDESIDGREASIRKNNGETIYSTFALVDLDNEISIGQYAVVVVINEARSNVLCVPKDSVKTENGISYVYVTDGQSTTYTEIQPGMQDDFFVEVLSGLNKGDKVVSNNAPRLGKNTALIEKGQCSTLSDISGFLYYPFSKWIVNPVDEGSAYIKEICVKEYQEVKKGDTILKIEAINDSVEIERITNRISRLNSRIQDEMARQADMDDKNQYITDPNRKLYDRNVNKNIVSYTKELNDANRQLRKHKKYSGIIEIKAETDGIISDIGTLKEGDVIYPDTKILQFADISTSYIVLKDEDGVLSYGQPASVDFAGSDGKRTEVKGRVVTVSNLSLSDKMKKQWALIEIDEEGKALMSGSKEAQEGLWARNSYKVSVNTRAMDNVLLIPKSAVEVKGGNTYVKVINSDGSVSLKGFISGGSNNNYYWVVSGLSEGTKICWD